MDTTKNLAAVTARQERQTARRRTCSDGCCIALFLLVAAAQCLVLLAGAPGAAEPRTRQGDYLDRLRGSPSSRVSLAVVSAEDRSAPSLSDVWHAAPTTAPAALGSQEADRMVMLLGQPNSMGFAQYAGYVMVDEVTGRALFYYLAKADGGSATSSKGPLLLWLNDGLVCSSLGYGTIEELGPFRVKSDGEMLSARMRWPPVSSHHVALTSPHCSSEVTMPFPTMSTGRGKEGRRRRKRS
uniref:Uncharacterized protein n=1 Tax=Oryza glumipatula TaxID=40148 RepID=A0A0E0A7E8_9ORYZ